MKIFVTGDNHIGLKYAGRANAARLARARIDVLKGMVDIANSQGCSLFAITGDLFENTYGISKEEVKAVLDYLGGFKGVVAVLPGNHDYYDRETKLWRYFEEEMIKRDNIMLLGEYRPYEIAGEAILYPAPCMQLHSNPGENNLDWIKKEEPKREGKLRIGIAHGAVEGETIDKEGLYFLMSRDELEAIDVDVWLIGHTHVPFPAELKEDSFTAAGRIFNAGTPVQTDVANRTEGYCFIIEIDDKRKVSAMKVRTGNVRFFRKEIALTAGRMAEIIRRETADLPAESVVDLVLTGAVSQEEYEGRRAIIEKGLNGFIESTYDDHKISRLITAEVIEKEFARTSFAAGLLNRLLDEPEQVQLAYELFKSIKEGK
ncbi:MAG: metallophosphoesterase family protein [Lachnospiraceae bacterium]|jgi:exonuclease SbcD